MNAQHGLLGSRFTGSATRSIRRCCLMLAALFVVAGAAWADDWPQWLGPERDGVWRETGIVEKFPDGGPPVRWRTPIGGGYAGPAVANGRVYVTDRQLARGQRAPAKAFSRSSAPGTERVLCLNEADGKVIWKHEYECTYTVDRPAGPRATPLVDDGKVYTLGTEGHLFCLDAESGEVRWSRDLKKDYRIEQTPLWGFSGHPLVDGQKLICLVGGPDSAVVAFDKGTGKEIWHALSVARGPHGAGYCPPMIYEAAGRRQLIVWHPEAVSSLDPDTGKQYWSQPFPVNQGLTISTPRKLGDLLFVTAFYDGPMMLRLDADRPAATMLWRGKGKSERETDGLHAIMCTPFLEDGYIYGVCSYGQFRCLRADTGERVWETYEPTGGKNARWANAFVVKHGNRFFLPNEKGDLIIANLSPSGYEEISRAHLLEPTLPEAGRDVVWSHPAFANRSVYLRNDKEIVCANLAAAAVAASATEEREEKKSDEKPKKEKKDDKSKKEKGDEKPKKDRTPDVIFVPTPQDVVEKMLELAEVKKTDLVLDLGCGDGRIVVTAAKKYGCKAIGYDIDSQRVKESRENVKKNEVEKLVTIEQEDIFKLDLSKAQVITLYLLPRLNVQLIPQLEKLKPGSRIVSHQFDMAGVKPDKVVTLKSKDTGIEHTIYLWTTPLKKEKGEQ